MPKTLQLQDCVVDAYFSVILSVHLSDCQTCLELTGWEESLCVRRYTISVSPASISNPNAMISRTPTKGSERHQIASASQKQPATVKQPTFTHLANFQFKSSSPIPITGRITSKTNSKHNWKLNAGNPTLRSLVNIAQATMIFAAKTQAPRKILFSTLEERPTSTNDKGLSFFICGSSRNYRVGCRATLRKRWPEHRAPMPIPRSITVMSIAR
jgi:hypothetical protein